MFYFAYGMNLDPSYMTRDMHERGPGTLTGWKLVFRGLANVEPADGEKVVGALWEIDERGLHYLDGREGYKAGRSNNLYDRLTVLVDNGDEKVEAIMYVMSDVQRGEYPVRPPSTGYLGIILTGYRHFGLAEEVLWSAVRKSCTGAQEFRALYHYTTKEVEQYA